MVDPKDSLLSSYDYVLDPKYIAQMPVEPRHSARLLIAQDFDQDKEEIRHVKVWDLQDELLPGDLLVVNNTRVIKARLKIRRTGGGLGELLVLEPYGTGLWLCLARPAKRLRKGDHIWIESPGRESIQLTVFETDTSTGGRFIQFPKQYDQYDSIARLLDEYGETPLPPYINAQDQEHYDRYQTCYAERPGAVAAPTAGLHLSEELLEAIKANDIRQAQVTLHVGVGTFRPIQTEDISNLALHKEWVEVGEEVVRAVADCRARGGRVIAVGTTTVRALEAAALEGDGVLTTFKGYVEIVIRPGYKFLVVDGLLTNFHLPKSSLLLLVSALIGREKLLALYAEAIEHQYRFFSYGDAMWIAPNSVVPDARPLGG